MRPASACCFPDQLWSDNGWQDMKTVTAKKKRTTKSAKVARKAKPALLAGGNPQIAKAEGDAPVRAYIAAMPGWKSDVGRRLDALIVRMVPGVRKAVKWNSHFRGASLRPVPPGESTHKDVRYVDIRKAAFDETQMASWIRQAAALPGWVP